MGGGECGCIGHYFGWGIIFGQWGWVGKYFGWVGMSGDKWGRVGMGGGEWGWVYCLIMPKKTSLFKKCKFNLK